VIRFADKIANLSTLSVAEKEIEWEIDYFTEPKERLSALKGFDEFGNEYEAGGQISTIDDEILKVEDIEKINKPIKRPGVAKDKIWRKS
jgi:hypothetical protein